MDREQILERANARTLADITLKGSVLTHVLDLCITAATAWQSEVQANEFTRYLYIELTGTIHNPQANACINHSNCSVRGIDDETLPPGVVRVVKFHEYTTIQTQHRGRRISIGVCKWCQYVLANVQLRDDEGAQI